MNRNGVARTGRPPMIVDTHAKICTALRPRTPAASPSAKKIAKSKELAEYVAEVLKYRRIESAARRATATARVTEPVIHSALLGVRQDCISLAAFFKVLFGVRIIGIAVRMKL